MANYMGMMRTNYFKVKDVEAFNELTNKLSAEDNITVEVTDENTCFIGCYSPIDYIDENNDYNIDEFYNKLSKLIADDDAAIFIEIGHEKLRYLIGLVVIVTTNDVKYLDLSNIAIETAKNMLNNPNWTTKLNY